MLEDDKVKEPDAISKGNKQNGCSRQFVFLNVCFVQGSLVACLLLFTLCFIVFLLFAHCHNLSDDKPIYCPLVSNGPTNRRLLFLFFGSFALCLIKSFPSDKLRISALGLLVILAILLISVVPIAWEALKARREMQAEKAKIETP